jgi:hypothetical protein
MYATVILEISPPPRRVLPQKCETNDWDLSARTVADLLEINLRKLRIHYIQSRISIGITHESFMLKDMITQKNSSIMKQTSKQSHAFTTVQHFLPVFIVLNKTFIWWLTNFGPHWQKTYSKIYWGNIYSLRYKRVWRWHINTNTIFLDIIIHSSALIWSTKFWGLDPLSSRNITFVST